MRILMVTSEVIPFSKSGGLADVISALSQEEANQGNEVVILMPLYSFINTRIFKKTSTYLVPLLGKNEEVSIFEKKVGNVTYAALSHPYFTKRLGIYGDTSFTPYADNCPRFTLFSKAAALFPLKTSFKADVVHSHDWTTGLVSYYLKQFKYKSKTVFTIHNLAYQGEFSSYDALLSGDKYSDELFIGKGENKKLNMLKAGIETSDYITTVSPTYSEEIQSEEQGCSLDWVLKKKKEKLKGIINGIDYNEWSPENDKHFKEHFSHKKLDGKKELKKRIQKEYNLEVNENIPLFSMITRLAEQKGFDALLLQGETPALERILKNHNVQFIIIGTGDDRYVKKLKEIEERNHNLSVNIVFEDKVAHNIEGASDFFLMPSKYEPCGLNQLYSLHYGTLPVARKTGGLKDTIKDLEENMLEGTGFLFQDLNDESIIASVEKAIKFYERKHELNDAIIRAMQEDFTWAKSASEYIDIYKSIKNKGR